MRTRQLPVVFHPLDLEGKTRPVPTLVCPVRGDVMTVGGCGRCPDFRHIEFTQDSRPVLCCSTNRRARTAVARVQDLLRVPVACTAPDTTLGLLEPLLQAGATDDVVPVLDLAARPIGFVATEELRRLLRAGIPRETAMSEVMSRLMVCVLPETTLEEARALLAETQSSQLFAVAADGSFLGLIAPRDVTGRGAASPAPSTHLLS
ncbi:MAG TPA: CBS domain-containing protein [Polyangiales bacterium]|nr:CBS domain-containing protein [Polyangiales bacterium]